MIKKMMRSSVFVLLSFGMMHAMDVREEQPIALENSHEALFEGLLKNNAYKDLYATLDTFINVEKRADIVTWLFKHCDAATESYSCAPLLMYAVQKMLAKNDVYTEEETSIVLQLILAIALLTRVDNEVVKAIDINSSYQESLYKDFMQYYAWHINKRAECLDMIRRKGTEFDTIKSLVTQKIGFSESVIPYWVYTVCVPSYKGISFINLMPVWSVTQPIIFSENVRFNGDPTILPVIRQQRKVVWGLVLAALESLHTWDDFLKAELLFPAA